MTDQPQSPIDHAVLEELRRSTGDDDAFLADLIETYLEDGAQQLAAIEAALDARNAAGLVRPAHTLKTGSATMGALSLAEICRRLEQAGREGVLDDSQARLTDARAEWSRVREALSAPVGRGAAR